MMDEVCFNIFCQLHPHEAAELDWARFVSYLQRRKPGISEDEIRRLLSATSVEHGVADRDHS